MHGNDLIALNVFCSVATPASNAVVSLLKNPITERASTISVIASVAPRSTSGLSLGKNRASTNAPIVGKKTINVNKVTGSNISI